MVSGEAMPILMASNSSSIPAVCRGLNRSNNAFIFAPWDISSALAGAYGIGNKAGRLKTAYPATARLDFPIVPLSFRVSAEYGCRHECRLFRRPHVAEAV